MTLKEWAEDPDHPTNTVYAYVPIFLLDDVIEKHGGIVGEYTQSEGVKENGNA